MVPASFTAATHDPALAELVSYSSNVSQRKFVRRSRRAGIESLHLSTQNWFPEDESRFAAVDTAAHAPPLMPLREQDLQALTDFFTHEEIDGILNDVVQSLDKYYPEPCWEDELLQALSELM